MTTHQLFILSFISTVLLSACSSTDNNSHRTQKPDKLTSYLASDINNANANANASVDDNRELKSKSGTNNNFSTQNKMQYLPPLSTKASISTVSINLSQQFSETKAVTITADDLPLKDYLHYVMGEQLNVSYILGEQVKDDNKPVTLNIQHQITERKLFSLSEELLNDRGYIVRHEDGIYYIHKSVGTNAKGNIAYGYGKSLDSVPNTSVNIVQLVPFTYGMQTSLANTLRQIVKIKATPDFDRSALILQGKRKDIIRALEFIHLMDQPAFKNRHIGVFKGNYVTTNELKVQLPKLLKQEGITIDTNGLTDKAVSLVSLEAIGTIVLFANSKEVLERVYFWATQIDQPPSGNQLQYFLYQPQFARATDLGESIQALLGGGSDSSMGNSTSASGQNKTNNTRQTNKRGKVNSGVSNGDTRLVIDERANALIFNTTGDNYRQLLPLIKRLDVMPKQIMLEVMIAEVTLTDVFKQGVEFALTNKGDVSLVGGFDLTSGSTGLSYLLSGAQGSLTYDLLQTNDNVNVLSRPSLLVRDGVTASIKVGERIPTVGEIVSDPNNGNRTSVVYQETGIDLQVTPTVNARGVVIMAITQNTTNQVPAADSVAGSPIFFERSINTEVVAESGQTIMLGGLISETRTTNDRTVPFFSSIPFIGRLFDATKDSSVKTELVVLVTPKVIESTDEWEDIMAKFTQNLSKLNINQ